MIIPVAAVVLMLLPALLGGRISRLAGVRFRFGGWVAGALALQVCVLEVVPLPKEAADAVHIGTYGLAAWFLWANRRIPGLWLVALGATTNGVTIAINGGQLPARAQSLQAAGIDLVPHQYVNSGVLPDPKLWFLGDVFAIPAGYPLANVFSVGDVMIVLGAGLASFLICGTRWWQPWDAASAGHAYRAPRHRADLPRQRRADLPRQRRADLSRQRRADLPRQRRAPADSADQPPASSTQDQRYVPGPSR